MFLFKFHVVALLFQIVYDTFFKHDRFALHNFLNVNYNFGTQRYNLNLDTAGK